MTLAEAQRRFERIDNALASLRLDHDAVEHYGDHALVRTQPRLFHAHCNAVFEHPHKAELMQQVAQRVGFDSPDEEREADESLFAMRSRDQLIENG